MKEKYLLIFFSVSENLQNVVSTSRISAFILLHMMGAFNHLVGKKKNLTQFV